MTLRKKAVSPIIATILLIVIALILVGILLSWGQNFIQRSTSDADNAIDRKCIGADIEFSVCNYNSQDKALSFIIVNTGKIDFKEDTNLSLTIIDSGNNLYETTEVGKITNILDGNAFTMGSSTQETIDLRDANPVMVSPLEVTIRSSQCNNFFKRVSCK